MKNFAALLFTTAFLAYETEAGDNACYFHKNKNECEKADGGTARYNLKDSSDSDCECQCKWNEEKANCKDGQEWYKDSKKKKGKASYTACGCKWTPCTPCEDENPKADEATATADDYTQGKPEDGCTCGPADPAKQCDAMYGGWWEQDAAGVDCPKPDDGSGDGDAGGDGDGEEKMGATALAAATLAIGTVLMF